jgi:hypothetical protein
LAAEVEKYVDKIVRNKFMVDSIKTAQLYSGSTSSLFTNGLSTRDIGSSLPTPLSFGTRSRLEIGKFDRVFSSSGSVKRNFADVFRFELTNKRRLRIYVGNQFDSSLNSRRMTVDLIDDRTLRRVTSTVVDPRRVDVITRSLNPGVYRVQISTQSSNRGRYFLDMVRV